MTEYQSNSHKSKRQEADSDIPEKKIAAVASGKTKKKSGLHKFADIFLEEDIDSVKGYIRDDVIIPSIKKGIDDIITNGISMLFYGKSGNVTAHKNNASRVSYRSYYNNEKPEDRAFGAPRVKSYNYDDVIIETRGEAEEVLIRMDELLATYNVVSVADFYDLVGVSNNSYTDNNYGWTNLNSAHIIRTREGYMIKFPKAMPID